MKAHHALTIALPVPPSAARLTKLLASVLQPLALFLNGDVAAASRGVTSPARSLYHPTPSRSGSRGVGSTPYRAAAAAAARCRWPAVSSRRMSCVIVSLHVRRAI